MLSALRFLICLPALLLLGSCRSITPPAAPPVAPMPGSDTHTPHRSTTEVLGTAIVQHVAEGVVQFDFTPDQGPTMAGQRVPRAAIIDLRDTVLEPGTRLRLRLVREFLQLGTTTPREQSRRWEVIRTR